MVTFSERTRLEDIQRREALGESFWSNELDDRARLKFAYLLDDSVEKIADSSRELNSWDLWGMISKKIARDFGDRPKRYDFSVIAQEHADAKIYDLVEAVELVSDQVESLSDFHDAVNRVLDDHRVNFQLAPNGKIIPRESQEIHASVVLPTLQLLHGREDLRQAESAYNSALREISDGKPADAITDAGVALQETLTALGASGNALGDQLKTAKAKTNLFAGRDQPLLNGISKVVDWAAAERNTNGDSHRVTGAVHDDAWMMVHIVGALILRIAGEPRK